MGGFLEFIGSVATIFKTWFSGKNTASEIANREAKRQQGVKDAVTADVAKGDLPAIERDIS